MSTTQSQLRLQLTVAFLAATTGNTARSMSGPCRIFFFSCFLPPVATCLLGDELERHLRTGSSAIQEWVHANRITLTPELCASCKQDRGAQTIESWNHGLRGSLNRALVTSAFEYINMHNPITVWGKARLFLWTSLEASARAP